MPIKTTQSSQEVFVCPSCHKRLTFSKVMYVAKDSKVVCNHCNAVLTPGNINTGTLYVVVMLLTVVFGFFLAMLFQPIVFPESRFMGRIMLYFPIMVGVYTLLAYIMFYRKIWFKKRES